MNSFLRTVAVIVLLTHAAVAQQRGELISLEQVAFKTHEQIREEVVDYVGGEIPERLIDLLMPTLYDVKAYRVVYGTIDGHGAPTVASGLAVLPEDCPHRLPIVAYHHGTFSDDASAPSNLGFEALIGYGFSTSGFLTVLPDYLGFGASSGVHPYVHADTEASSAIDLMRAARLAAQYGGHALNGQVFLTGYSQGGHAAVATMREIERAHLGEFNLAMTAAGSGPYSLANVQYHYSVDNPQYPTRSYLPFLLLGYQDIYGNLYQDLSEVFVPPYDELIPTLFDRQHTMGQINRMLPVNWREMFVPAYLEALETNPSHPVRRALQDNDLLNFKPQTPLVMYYATMDEQVDYRNALAAWFYYKLVRRSTTTVVAARVGPYDHGGIAVPISLGLARFNFAYLRTP